jgi:predicted MPP superfamily phosphohydrolase
MDVRTVTYTLKSDRITAISGTIRLVQISDVHLGLMTGAYRTKRIIRVIEQARPDILVSTGDLIDGQTDNIEQTARLFGGITPRFGKFAVAGNHELYAGPELSRALTESGGFRMLNDESIKAGPVRLVGVMDRGHSLQGRIQSEIVKGLLMQSADDYTVLLKHNPSLLNGTEGMFDLQLSGHLHGGQVFPFIPLVRVFYPFISGLHRITDRSMLYISPGTGFWGPPMRVFARPEVTVFEIIPSS